MQLHHIEHKQHHCEGNPDIIKVLMYHRIVDDERLSRASWLCLHEREFRRQLSLLERWGFTPITFNDYRLFLEGELNLPKKPIILTFDDGYRDTHEIAFPLLREFGMRAVVFVLGDRNVKSNNWDRFDGIAPAPLLEPNQIVEMHAGGIEIGSHSMSHSKLTEIPKDKLWEEVSRSRMVLEILLNSPVHSFSYPYGLVNRFTEKMVAEAGYLFGCGVYTGPPTFGVAPYHIRRIEIRSTTNILSFAAKVLTPYQYYAWLRWKTKNIVSRKRDLPSKNSEKVSAKKYMITPPIL